MPTARLRRLRPDTLVYSYEWFEDDHRVTDAVDLWALPPVTLPHGWEFADEDPSAARPGWELGSDQRCGSRCPRQRCCWLASTRASPIGELLAVEEGAEQVHQSGEAFGRDLDGDAPRASPHRRAGRPRRRPPERRDGGRSPRRGHPVLIAPPPSRRFGPGPPGRWRARAAAAGRARPLVPPGPARERAAPASPRTAPPS